MASVFIPAQGGPQMLPWPLGVDAEMADVVAVSADRPIRRPPDPDDVLDPFVGVVAIHFQSDHQQKMTDKGYWEDEQGLPPAKPDFASGGHPFAKDSQWKMDSYKGWTISKPVSHTGGKKIKLAVTIDNRYARRVRAKLVGTVTEPASAAGMEFVVSERWYEEGLTQEIVLSDEALPKTVETGQFKVRWELTGDWLTTAQLASPTLAFAPPIVSQNPLFITLGEPRFKTNEDEITFERMVHAVGKAALAQSTSVHAIVRHLVLNTPFNGVLGQAHDPWFFAKNPGEGADCFTTAVYIAAILDLIGAQAAIRAEIVFVRPKDGIRWRALQPEEPGRPIHTTGPFPSALAKVLLLDDVRRRDFEVVTEWNVPNPEYAGIYWPKLFHRYGDRFLFMIDSEGGLNKYEGCVKLTAEGKTLWYPAGTYLDGIESPEKVVERVFESFKWADAKTESIVGDIPD